MKRSNIVVRALLVTGLSVGAFGCKDFVDLTPKDVIPVGAFYKTESDFRGLLIGTYGSLRSIYNTYYAFTELPSDNARTYGESESAWGPFDKLSWNATTGIISTNFNESYRTIANANILLDRIDPVSFANPATKVQYIGEAKFLRALMYFNLVRFYGRVPLVLHEIDENQANAFVQSEPKDIYAQIEKDLTDAEVALAAPYPAINPGRATIGAVRALLGKVYMQEKPAKWAEAEAVLGQVVNSGTYSLPADVNNVFGLGKDNNSEIVFAVQYLSTGAGEGNSFVHNFSPQGSVGIISVGGNSTSMGTRDLYDAFEANDTRRAAFIGLYPVPNPTATPPVTLNNNTYFWARKFVYNIAQTNEGDNDWPVLRLADVKLMYAEALNNNGKTTQAIPQINDIRQRAGLPAVASTLTPVDTQLAIEKERRVELCFEGHRWHDLIRWGKDQSVLNAFRTRYTVTSNPGYDAANSGIVIDANARTRLFPIPDREIRINANLIQNPGY